MAYELIPVELRETGKLVDTVVVLGTIANGYVDREFPLASFNDAVIAAKDAGREASIDLQGLKVRFAGSSHSGSWATIFSQYAADAGTFVVTEIRTGGRSGDTVAKLA